VVIAPDRRKHADAVIDLMGKALPQGRGYYWMRDACRDVYLLRAHYDWRPSRIGLISNRVVTHFGIWDYQMRVGSARVRVGGVGGVATDGDYRKRGLMDRTARASMEAMRAQGYDVSLLFGIDDFYHRFGYVRAWSDMVVAVEARDLPNEKPTVRVSGFKPRAQRDLAELYNRCYATTTGTAVRPTYRGTSNPWFDLPVGYKWNENGKPAGYVLLRRHGNRITCGEYCGDAEDTLRILGVLARRWNCQEIRFDSLPYNCELIRKLRWGNSRVEIRNHRNGSALIALLNLASTLSKMEGELSSRLRSSALADWAGDLLIADTRDEVMLSLSGGQVRATQPGATSNAIRGGDEIVQLLIGTDRPAEVIEAGRMRLSGDAARLAEVLFPEQHPTLSQADHF
jgi:hypothetical protein